MSKNFVHDWVQTPSLKQINTENGRRYSGEGGFKYPSITTVLDKTSDKTSLFEWRKRVGEEKANAISRNAARRGTSMHKLCERYLKNEEVDAPPPTAAEDLDFEDVNKGDWTAGQMMFSIIKPSLDRLDNVRILEKALVSHNLKVAGTVDCVADFDGELAIVDFKTSRRPKSKEHIDSYFMQGAFYLNAFYETTGELPKQIAILISVQDGTNQVFTVRGKELIYWTERLKERIERYYNVIDTTKG